MRILITGGSGLVGSHIVEYLKQKSYEVIAPLSNELDITSQTSISSFFEKEKPDIVFNLAERFNGDPALVSHVAALLEMNSVPFTGASSAFFST